MKVAWIGMGRIGKLMALRVLKAGHSLTGHARTPAKVQDIFAAGGHVTTDLAQAVHQAEMVCVNLYSEAQLREVLVEGGALQAIAPGALLVIHSTVGPAIVQEIAALRPDLRLLDAAFSGIDKDAIAGTITLMVGGTAEALDAARPVLSTYASSIHHVGPSGAGMAMKLVNNALFGAQMILARDALALLNQAGVDKDVAVETLSRSSGASFAISQFGPGIDVEWRMAGIWPYMRKDVDAAREAAARAGYDLGMLDIATRPFITPEA